jgi:acetyltransferase-like isoleucine patch superfamily enzyme
MSDKRFCINTQVPDRLFKGNISSYEIVEIPLKNLWCYQGERLMRVNETNIYKFLDEPENSRFFYKLYCTKYPSGNSNDTNYNSLTQQLDNIDYDITKGAIVINQLEIILDGQYRCSILLKKYGPDFKIKVVKIKYCNPLLGLRKLLYLRKIKDSMQKFIYGAINPIGGGKMLIARLLRIEQIFCYVCKKKRKGEIESKWLRHFYSEKYHVVAKEYTYGCFVPGFNFGGKYVHVGRYCSIASDVRYFGGNHPMSEISTSPIFYNKSLGYCDNDICRYGLEIEDDVWIGYGVRITAGCHKIGRGAVIGAGSVVTKDILPYEIVAGAPAKHIRFRFSEQDMYNIEQSHWWLLSPNEIIEAKNNSTTKEEFRNKCISLLHSKNFN